MAMRKKVASRKASKQKTPARKAAPKSKKKTTTKKTPKKVARRATRNAAPRATKKKAARKATLVRRSLRAAVDGPGHGFEPFKHKRGEPYMDERMHGHFRGILVAWKRDLMEEVDRTVHHMKDEAANFPDPNDRATQESEFSLELRARDRERKLIKKIDESIASIEIGVRRLEARPTATLCIDCKTLDEIRERQRT